MEPPCPFDPASGTLVRRLGAGLVVVRCQAIHREPQMFTGVKTRKDGWCRITGRFLPKGSPAYAPLRRAAAYCYISAEAIETTAEGEQIKAKKLENQKSAPVRVQLRRSRGWRMPPDCVKVARPGRWGNPFRVGDPDPERPAAIMDNRRAVELFEAKVRREGWDLSPLFGKSLACFCPPGLPCHADVLLRLAGEQAAQK